MTLPSLAVSPRDPPRTARPGVQEVRVRELYPGTLHRRTLRPGTRHRALSLGRSPGTAVWRVAPCRSMARGLIRQAIPFSPGIQPPRSGPPGAPGRGNGSPEGPAPEPPGAPPAPAEPAEQV